MIFEKGRKYVDVYYQYYCKLGDPLATKQHKIVGLV